MEYCHIRDLNTHQIIAETNTLHEAKSHIFTLVGGKHGSFRYKESHPSANQTNYTYRFLKPRGYNYRIEHIIEED